MKKYFSFGGGLQTTAMTILAVNGEIEVDEAIFADTGCEMPETYWYIDNYIRPLLDDNNIKFTITKTYLPGIYEYCWDKKLLPSVIHRWCTDKWKVQPLKKYIGKDGISMVGFSADESHRVKEIYSKLGRQYPLIEKGITSEGCRQIIRDFGWPIPLKSACIICPYRRWSMWNWIKLHHPEIIQKCVDLEMRHYERYPHLKDEYGLFAGKPLWKYQLGIQTEMPILPDYSCMSGICGH